MSRAETHLDSDELFTQAESTRAIVASLTNAAAMKEHVLAAAEGLALDLLDRAVRSGHSEGAVLSALAPLFQAIVSAAEIYDLPLSTETESSLLRFREGGFEIQETSPRPLTRPLALAPQGPGDYSVFVDESGSGSFPDAAQPVLSLVGVIIKDDAIHEFERRAESLLLHRGLAKDTEFHAQTFITGDPKGQVGMLDADARYALLRAFVVLGMSDVRIHHISMLKAAVKPAYRQKMVAQGLDAYSHSVVWFAITLDRACLLITMPSMYKYYYDRTDAYQKDIGRIFRALKETPNKRLRLIGLKGEPTKLESHKNRCIQLADVVGYYLARYREFEAPAFAPRPALGKHEGKIREIYALIKPRLVDYIGKDLYRTVDWRALQDFSLKRSPKPQWRPPVGRPRR